MRRVSRFWNLRMKLVALLGCLLAGTLAAQSWLHDASERQLLQAVEEMAEGIVAETVELTMNATVAVPVRPTRIAITFHANPRSPGSTQLVPDAKTGALLRNLQRHVKNSLDLEYQEALQSERMIEEFNNDELIQALIQANHPEVDVQEALAYNEWEAVKQQRLKSESLPQEEPASTARRPLIGENDPILITSRSGRFEASTGSRFAGRRGGAAALSVRDEDREAGQPPMAYGGRSRELSDPAQEDFAVGVVAEGLTLAERALDQGENGPGSNEFSAPARSDVEMGFKAPEVTPSGTVSLTEEKVDPEGGLNEGRLYPEQDTLFTSGIDLQPHLDRLKNLVRDARQRDLQATIGVFLLGVVLAWLLGTRLVRPVTEVVDGMRVVASGDLEVRLPDREDPEFGIVSRQFNDMVERLADARRIERGLEHRERVQTMGDLAAGVAHDIRNPLSAISLHVGRIRREFEPTDPQARDRFRSFTGDVKEEIERLNLLVTDFLQLAQPASHEAESVFPGELLEDLHRLLEKEAATHQVKLLVEVQEDLCEARWNRIEAKSAFLNVAMNAIQAMDGDGGTLVMKAQSDQQWAVISFVDDGPGISSTDLQKVTLPYVTMRPGGTGLGLAIARRVAERHGGRLELSSEVGVGTEVRFLMPVEDGEEER